MKNFQRIIVRPYSSECGGARDIVKILKDMGVPSKRVYSKQDQYQPEDTDFIINWGASYPPDWAPLLKKSNIVLNHWNSVYNSISKIRSFENFKKHQVSTPEWTLTRQQAEIWIKTNWVCCRTNEASYDGKGLILAKKASELEWAPLYTLFIDGIREYRAYVFKGELIDLLYKYPSDKIKNDVIRTETNGWRYERSSYYINKKIADIASKAIEANGMDFGGIDIIEDQMGNYFVLETNSEPGIGIITAGRFANAIRKEAGL